MRTIPFAGASATRTDACLGVLDGVREALGTDEPERRGHLRRDRHVRQLEVDLDGQADREPLERGDESGSIDAAEPAHERVELGAHTGELLPGSVERGRERLASAGLRSRPVHEPLHVRERCAGAALEPLGEAPPLLFFGQQQPPPRRVDGVRLAAHLRSAGGHARPRGRPLRSPPIESAASSSVSGS